MWVKIDELAYVSTDGEAEITYQIVPGNEFLLGGGYWLLSTDDFERDYFSLHEAQRAYEHYLKTGEIL